jgi:raffinose/stachyose/melibiose transport system substrate-binding protein
MKRTSRFISILVCLCIFVSLFAGCGSTSASTADEKKDSSTTTVSEDKKESTPAPAETEKVAKKIKYVTADGQDSPPFKAIMSVLADYQKDVNPNFSIEVESIPVRSQYDQKLRTYIAAGEIPDMFNVEKNPYGVSLWKQGKLADMGKFLKDIGKYDSFLEAAVAYQSLDDGSLFTYPVSANGEAFWYWTKHFKENNITPPKTFDELVTVCKTLKDKGLTPIAIGGKEKWQLLRYLSFIPFRMTYVDYVQKLKVGKESMKSDVGMKAVNFLNDLSKAGSFQKGFANMDYTQTLNLFLGGNAVIHYNGSWEVGKFADEYEKGNISYFMLPEVAGANNIPTNTYLGSGFGFGFAAESFDAQVQDFVKYFTDKYHPVCFKMGYFSPFKEAAPSDVPKLLQDFAADMSKSKQNCMVWDNVLDPATFEVMGTEAVGLMLGANTPASFAEKMDKTIKENAPKFFKDEMK